MATSDLTLATSEQDSLAIESARERYAELLGYQAALTSALFAAISTSDDTFEHARESIMEFFYYQLRPQLRASVEIIYPACTGLEHTRLLIEGLLGETQLVEQAVARIVHDHDRVQLAAHVEALRVLLESLFGKIADILLPALAQNPNVSLAEIVEKIADLESEEHGCCSSDSSGGCCSSDGDAASGCCGGHDAEETSGCYGGHDEAPRADSHVGGCGCGEEDEELPILDVRDIPHAIRHATVFGAFDAIPVGGSMILIAPHDPVPLLQQLAQRTNGRIAVGYEQRGGDQWRLRLTRV